MTDSQRSAPNLRLTCGDCAEDIDGLLGDVEDALGGESNSAPGTTRV
jgi:hypothetical protein